MIKSTCILLILSLFVMISCNDCIKEEELIQRENTLNLKENQFAEKEAEYLALLQMRDSLNSVQDSTVYLNWPDSISGIWSSKVVCTESNCNDYVIGDQRVDNWEFVQDSTGLITRVLNNKNEIVRTYTAQFSPSGILLQFKTDSLAEKQVVMNINLDNIKSDKLSGKRNISVDNNCSAVFNVELTRPNPKK